MWMWKTAEELRKAVRARTQLALADAMFDTLCEQFSGETPDSLKDSAIDFIARYYSDHFISFLMGEDEEEGVEEVGW